MTFVLIAALCTLCLGAGLVVGYKLGYWRASRGRGLGSSAAQRALETRRDERHEAIDAARARDVAAIADGDPADVFRRMRDEDSE